MPGLRKTGYPMEQPAALILCDGFLGTSMGKTANGLVRYSRRFRIAGVIDSTKAGMDAGEVVDGVKKGIPIFPSVDDAVTALLKDNIKPSFIIVGVASIGGYLPKEFRPAIKSALECGINVISGLHEFLADDPELGPMAARHGAKILDIRKEPPIDQMHLFRNLCAALPVPRIPILGTDSAIGKRTTALILTDALNRAGVKTQFVATGQTGLLQGAKYGIPLDAIQGDYMVGELEHAIYSAYEHEKPQAIIVEGQGSISHPAYVCGTRAIINASRPSGIILQHAPGRKTRGYHRDELKLPMPDIKDEISLLEHFSGSKVIAITINHENLSDSEVFGYEVAYEKDLGLPTQDVLKNGSDRIVAAVKKKFGL